MKFSVIIPTHNRICLLERAIQSVAIQTYQNFEIIVVNDNPSDRTEIDELIRNYDKIKVIHHAKSQGAGSARNSGIINSSGELIAFLDDDDFWLPEKLIMHLKEHQNNPDAGLVYSDCLYVYNSPFVNDQVNSLKLYSNTIEAMAKGVCPSTSSIVSINRKCVEKCGLFDEMLINMEDWDYWFRIAHFYKFSHIPQVLVHYNWHLQNRSSQNQINRRRDLSRIFTKWKDEINAALFAEKIYRSMYYNDSKSALITGDKFDAFKKSFKLLNKKVVGIRSIKQFIKINIGIFKKSLRNEIAMD